MIKLESNNNSERFLDFVVHVKPNKDQPIRDIYVLDINEEDSYCGQCYNELKPKENTIPVSELCYLQVPGKFCEECNRFYVDFETGKTIRDILTVNSFTKDFTIDNEHLFQRPPYERTSLDRILSDLKQIAEEERHYKKIKEQVRLSHRTELAELLENNHKSNHLVFSAKKRLFV